MPKCPKCGKKFDSLQALSDHFRAVHPNQRFVAPKTSSYRNFTVILVIVIIVIGGLVGYLIYSQSTSSSSTTQSNSVLLTPISFALYQNLTTVSDSTLSQVGLATGVAAPTSISGSPLMLNNKPEILYIGAEFCPLCAANRWSLIVALSKFGNFSGLQYMLSAVDDGNYSTMSFRSMSYVSQYISFVSVENEDRDHNVFQLPNQTEQNLWNTYNPNAYPFIDIGGSYVVKSEMYNSAALKGLSWTQIGSQLNNPSSSLAKLIDGAANSIISDVCKIDGGNPSSVCGQSFANLSLTLRQPATDSAYLVVLTQDSLPSLGKRPF